MTANGHNLQRKYEPFLAALLTEPTIAEAAKKARISEATALRWLKIPEVEDAYRDARRQLVTHAMSIIQRATGAAVATLIRNLKADSASVQVSAARALLEYAIRAVEVDDLTERLEDVEEALGVIESQHINRRYFS